jgi:Ca-activated chloride channel family protein
MSGGELQLGFPWALLLLVLPLLVRLLPAHRQARESVRAPFFRDLARVAGLEPSPGAVALSRTLWQRILVPLGWLLVVTALARPQWVEEPMTQIESARDLMLSVDLSGSMETRDFEQPDGRLVDRLTAVKLVLDDFVSRREADRLGLILFGSAAFLQVPFTLDHAVFRDLLEEAQIGVAGPHTMLGDSIGLAIKAFEASEAEQRVVILLTDGNDTQSKVPPVKAAELAARKDITIHTIGVGDPAAAGEAPLDEQTLREVARLTGGQYFRARDLGELEEVYERLDALEPLDYEAFSYRPRHELYAWPLGAFLALVLGYHLLNLLRTLRARRPGQEAA